MTDTDLRYIEPRSGKFRVKVPDGDTRKNLGTFPTLDEAIEIRDAFLSQQSTIDSPANESPLPSVPIPKQAWDAKPLQLDLIDKWLYCADLHIPSHSAKMLERLIAVAQYENVKRLVIGGDLMDMATISQWPNIVPQHSLSYTQEMTGDVLVMLGEIFEEIVVVPGNHDARLVKKLNTHMSFESILWSCIKGRTLKGKLIASDFPFVYIGDEGSSGPDIGIVAGHPTFYSSVAAKTLADVAMLQHRNVLGSHVHIVGQMFSKCGRYWAVDPGCMCDENNTPYHQLNAGLSKFPAWRQGFVLMRHNRPQLLTDGWVNWGDFGIE